jgi:hypothetical protein
MIMLSFSILEGYDLDFLFFVFISWTFVNFVLYSGIFIKIGACVSGRGLWGRCLSELPPFGFDSSEIGTISSKLGECCELHFCNWCAR